MEPWQKEHIIKNLRELLQNTLCSTMLLVQLQSSDVISQNDVQQIEANSTQIGKAKKLYDIIQTRSNGYYVMMKALSKENQNGAFDILMKGVSSFGVAKLKVEFHGTVTVLEDLISADFQLIGGRLKDKDEQYIELIFNNQTEGNALKLVNDRIPPPLPYYIPREFSTRTKLSLDCFKAHCPDVFVFTDIGRVQLTKLAKPQSTASSSSQLLKITSRFIVLESIIDWSQICKVSRHPVHLIRFADNSKNYILKETHGSIAGIQKYLQYDESLSDCPILSEDEFISVHQSETKLSGVCICDTPGMGKSVVLASLAQKMIKEKNTIVAYITLSAFLQNPSVRLSQGDKKNALRLIVHYVSPSPLAEDILIKLIESKSVTIFFCFDGYDEIGQEDAKWIDKVLSEVIRESKNVKIYVTSRPHMRKHLELTYNSVAYDIIPFTEENQVDFLSNYWKCKDPDDRDLLKLTSFAKSCLQSLKNIISEQQRDIMGIPLQCYLLAEVYTEQALLCSDPEREASSSESFKTVGSFHEIYKMFIDLRFSRLPELKPASKYGSFRETVLNALNNIYPRIKKKTFGKSKFKKLSPKEMDEVKRFHVFKALQLIFPDIACEYAEYHKIKTDVTLHHLSFGILEQQQLSSQEDECIFIHRTIAEYLIAEFFDSVLSESANTTIKYLKFCVRMIKYLVDKCFQSFEEVDPSISLQHQNYMVPINSFPEYYHNPTTDSRTISSSIGYYDAYSTFKYSVIQYFLNELQNEHKCTFSMHQLLVNAFLSTLQPSNLLKLIMAVIFNNHKYLLKLLRKIIKRGSSERLQQYRSFLLSNFVEVGWGMKEPIHECLKLWVLTTQVLDVQMPKQYFKLFKVAFQLDLSTMWTNVPPYIYTPLHFAICRSSYEMVEYLVDKILLERRCLIYYCIHYSYFTEKAMLEIKMEICKLLLHENPNLITEVAYIKSRSKQKLEGPVVTSHVNIEILKNIILQGADMHATKGGNNLTVCAARYLYQTDFHELCLFLIEDQQALFLFNTNQPRWNSPLYILLAMRENVRDHTIKLLLSKLDIRQIEMVEKRSLIFAALCGQRNLSVIEFLIERGANVNFRSKNGSTLLHAAVGHRKLGFSCENFEYFLNLGFDINQGNRVGDTPLHKVSGNLEEVKYLISKGANALTLNKYGQSFAYKCALYGDEDHFHDTVAYLLEECSAAEIYRQQTGNGDRDTIIHRRLKFGHLHIRTLKLLLSIPGIDVNAKDADGNNMFLCAVKGQQSVSALMSLVFHGADYLVTNDRGENALHLCLHKIFTKIYKNFEDTARYLVSLGVNVQHLNNKGNTPIGKLIKYYWYVWGTDQQKDVILEIMGIPKEMQIPNRVPCTTKEREHILWAQVLSKGNKV